MKNSTDITESNVVQYALSRINSMIKGDILMMSLVGSRNMGIHSEDSDYDLIGIHVPDKDSPKDYSQFQIILDRNIEVTLMDIRGIKELILLPFFTPMFFSSHCYVDKKVESVLSEVPSYLENNSYRMLIEVMKHVDREIIDNKLTYRNVRDLITFMSFQESRYTLYGCFKSNGVYLKLLEELRRPNNYQYLIQHYIRSIKENHNKSVREIIPESRFEEEVDKLLQVLYSH